MNNNECHYFAYCITHSNTTGNIMSTVKRTLSPPILHSMYGVRSSAGEIELSTSACHKTTNTLENKSIRHESSPLHDLDDTPISEVGRTITINSLHGGGSSVFGASFNFVNSIVGAGIIAIPLAIQECGLVLGVFLLLLVAFLVNRSVLMLIDCGIKTNKFDYEELAEHLLGKRGYYVALIFMFLFAYGAQVAYLVIIGDTVPRAAQLLFPGSFFCSRQNTLLLLSTLIVLPLCLFRDLSTLSWTSLLSIIGVVVIVLIVLVACITVTNHQDEHFQVSDTSEVNDNLFAGVGTMSFAFVCQHNSFMVFRSLAQPTAQEWRKVAHLSISFASFVCVSFGLIGFFTFYPYVQGDLLNNFPVDDLSIATARLFLAVTMIFTYPMECYVTRHCVVAFMRKYAETTLARGANVSLLSSTTSSSRANDGSIQTTVAYLWSTISAFLWNLRNNGTADAHSTHSPYGHLANGARGSPSKSRNQGSSTYTNVQEEGEDVTIMFVENQVLMLYDVSIDDAPDTPAGQQRPHPSQAVTAGVDKKVAGAVRNPLLVNGVPPPESISNGIIRKRPGSEESECVSDANAMHAVPDVSLSVHVVLTLVIWGSTLCIALVFRQLGVVSALTGAVAASVLGYILPAVLYLKAHDTELLSAYNASLAIYHHRTPEGGEGSDNANQPDKMLSAEDIAMAEAGVVEITFNIDDMDDDVSNSAAPAKERTLSCNAVVRYLRMITVFRPFYLSFGLIVFGILSLVIGVTTVLMNAA